MRLATRFLLWSGTALLSFGADVVTKAAPHPVVIDNYSHTPAIVLLVVGVFLCVLGLWHSNWLAIGAGFMFGGLCGNGGQLLVYGYASDWIPVAGWLTNVADISGAIGLVCCLAGYVTSLLRRPVAVPTRGAVTNR